MKRGTVVLMKKGRVDNRSYVLSLHSRLYHIPPQQGEYASSFLNLRPIQTKIKTFITLFAK